MQTRRGNVIKISTGICALWAALTCSTPRPATAQAPTPAQTPSDARLRIIAFGAHPDDCELRAAGTAAKWAALGHHVKFVSVTNGDIGHWNMAGGPLATRRRAEVEQTAKILGVTTQVLDIHDGELMATLENRRTITRLIREWKADIVISHRPNDYHPDHRNAALLVQDAGYMVTVPFFCPDTPYLARNPVFMFYEDGFVKPTPFAADVVIAIDEVVPKKLEAIAALESQFYEGGANGGPALTPKAATAQAARRQAVRDRFTGSFAATANRFRKELIARYGESKGGTAKSAEAFEICEYGRRPGAEELRNLFPF